MLEGLLGSKSVEKILLFLLVNEKGYATQIHRTLSTPLTPLQKGFERLEREGMLTSHLEGKTRLFTFNPHYPLLKELEALLQKAYALLPAQEKSSYYFLKRGGEEHRAHQTLLDRVWKHLSRVHEVSFRFNSQRRGEGTGKGRVEVEKTATGALLFRERGVWRGAQGEEFGFTNIFRWSLNRLEGLLSLEHLRFGPDHPVFLFHLVPVGGGSLESHHPHLCGKDTYLGQMRVRPTSLELTWRILGPQKNEEVRYHYHV